MLYGYAQDPPGNQELLELREVTFKFPADALRQIAEFLTSCADLLDRGAFKHSHLHLNNSESDWSDKFPRVDVIVARP